MNIFKFIICAMLRLGMALVILEPEKNISDVSIGLSQIVNSIHPNQLAILVNPLDIFNTSLEKNQLVHEEQQILQTHIDEILQDLHYFNIKLVIFYDSKLFFKFVESSLQGSIESVNLIFCKPYDLMQGINDHKLAHRLSLFIFYWGAKYPPKRAELNFREQMRAVVITRPRKRAFRIYYNQAYPDGMGRLTLVSWFDGDNLGLNKEPLLPTSKSVYSNFQGRVFRVPVFHSPPWFWVNYINDSYTNNSMENSMSEKSILTDDTDEIKEVNVTGGRDHRLLQLLAKHLNFEFVYMEAHGRTQGSLRNDDEANETFTGGIGMLQIGLADLFLGDVSLSWERRKAIEFSFFTLADSGAFATHAPRRLNEALAILRPFKADVWPYLILTIIVSGPVFYFVISTPYHWHISTVNKFSEKIATQNIFHMCYIKEITRLDTQFQRRLAKTGQHFCSGYDELEKLPSNLFNRCIWFTVQLFLKQSCQELYHGYRAKFLMIVYWIAATYVLADVYSAQLTSQFARPAREPPINTLQRLQRVMIHDGYQLYVEKESTSLKILENGTEIFRQLYALMKLQSSDHEDYLIDSVEAGIKLIADGLENKAVLGGRETLFFNIQQYGSKTFQLSHKLYTRYSAVAVQIGCPFLDSLNDVLIHLFEGGILDKMTTAEYEIQSRIISKDMNRKKQTTNENSPETTTSSKEPNTSNEATGKSADNAEMKKPQDTTIIQPINLCMLQGAFIVLIVGFTLAGLMLLLELFCHGINFNTIRVCKTNLHKELKFLKRKIRKTRRWLALRFKQ